MFAYVCFTSGFFPFAPLLSKDVRAKGNFSGNHRKYFQITEIREPKPNPKPTIPTYISFPLIYAFQRVQNFEAKQMETTFEVVGVVVVSTVVVVGSKQV